MSALALDRQGWLKPHATVTLAPSPNCDKRPRGVEPTLLVIHNISLPPGQFGHDPMAEVAPGVNGGGERDGEEQQDGDAAALQGGFHGTVNVSGPDERPSVPQPD